MSTNLSETRIKISAKESTPRDKDNGLKRRGTLNSEALSTLKPPTIRAGQETLLGMQSELVEDFKAMAERQTRILAESEKNTGITKEFILEERKRSEELCSQMRSFLQDVDNKHQQEMSKREQMMQAREAQLELERKTRDEAYHKQMEKILNDLDQDRKAREESHQKEMGRLTEEHRTVTRQLTDVFMIFVNDERKFTAAQRKKDEDRRIQENVGLRFGLGSTVMVIVTVGTGIILYAGPSIPVVTGVLGLGSLALTYTTNVGKVFWKKIRGCFSPCTPDCLALAAGPDEPVTLLTMQMSKNLDILSPVKDIPATQDDVPEVTTKVPHGSKKPSNSSNSSPLTGITIVSDATSLASNISVGSNLGSDVTFPLPGVPDPEGKDQDDVKPFLMSDAAIVASHGDQSHAKPKMPVSSVVIKQSLYQA